MHPGDLHARVQDAFNAGDVEALVRLYEDDAWLFGPDGPVQRHEAIRALWTGFVAMGGQVELVTRYVVEHGDVALLSNRWTISIGDDQLSATTAEVARRQPDGTWRYVIDNPDGAGVLAGQVGDHGRRNNDRCPGRLNAPTWRSRSRPTRYSRTICGPRPAHTRRSRPG